MSWVAGPEMMEEDVELEEGEAGYLNSNDDKSIDPDVALSYIDDKLQSILGHFQKDFEEGASAEKLGAIYGGYGSFLPMYQRSPAILSQQKSPQRVQSNITRSPDRSHREGTARSSSSIPDATLRERDGATAPHVMHSLHDEKVSLGNDIQRKEKDLSSEHVAKKLPPIYKPSPNKSLNATDQKTLKFRIKVGSGKSAQKNVAIYSGLGLNSPSSSHGNSPGGSGEVPCESRENRQESPTRILQMLSTLTDALGPLLSPLPDRFFNLLRDVPMEGKSSPGLKVKLHQSATFKDHSDSKVDDQLINKRKKINTIGKCEPVQEDAVLLRLKENSGAEALDSQKPQSDCVNKSGGSLRNSSKPLDSLKGIEKGTPMKNKKLNNNSIMGRLLSADVVKHKSLDSESGQDGTKFKRQEATSSSVEKIVAKDPPCEIPESRRNEVDGVAFSSKLESDTFESGKEYKGTDHSLPKGGLRATVHEQEKSRMPDHGKKMPPESKKRSKLSQINGKVPSDSLNYGSDAGLSAGSEKKSGRKDISKARDVYEDLFGYSEATVGSSVDLLEKPSNNGSKGSIDTVKNENVHRDILKVKTKRNKVINQQTSESSMKDPLNYSMPPDNGLPLEVEPTTQALETEQTTAAPLWIEDWVQCEWCDRWRLLPYGRKPEQLPEKWVCTMLDWLPGMNRCDISEDVTTTTVQASYQLPLSDNQNVGQSHADRVVTGVNSLGGHYSYAGNSDVISGNVANGSKNKHKVKGTSLKGSNMTSAARIIEQSPVRRESLNDKKQQNSGVKPISNSIGQHRNGVEKHSNNQKLEHLTRGEVKLKRKSKGVSDQYEQPIAKKVKSGRTSDIIESPISNGSLGRNEFYSTPSLPAVASVNDKRKSIEHSRTKDSKSEEGITLQPSAKQVEDTLLGGSVDVKRSSDSHMSLKKRKLMDWQNSQSNVEALKNDGHSLTAGKIPLVGEDSDSGVGRIKKPMVLQTDGNLLSRTKFNDEVMQKDTKNRLLASAAKDSTLDKDSEKEKQLREHKIKVASQLTKAELESLKKALTSEQIPAAATSSSSKVSDSCKTRAHYLENRGSPVESVSSSPLRMPTVDKLSHNDDVKAGDFPTFRSPLKFENGSWDSRQSGKVKVRRPAGIGHPESSNNRELNFRESEDVGNSVDNGRLEANRRGTLEGHGPHLTDEPHSEPCYDKDRTSRKRYTVSLQQKSGMTASMSPMDKERPMDLNSKEPPERGFPPRDRQKMSKQKKHSRVITEVDQSPVAPSSEGLYDNNRQKSTSGSVKSCKVTNKASKKIVIDKRENGLKREHQNSVVNLKDSCPPDANVHNHLYQGCQSEKVRETFPVEDCGDEKPHPSQHTQVKHEIPSTVIMVASEHQKKNLAVLPPRDATGCRESKDFGKAIHKSESLKGSAHSVPDGPVAQIPTGPSFSKSSASVHAAASVVLQEAEGFKEYADRLKDTGFGYECNETYFQAALKFLHGASLLERTNGSRKHDEMNQTQIYISSAKLCETCAEEYERRQEMAAAALAYKCMEVAYMRVVYCKNNTVNGLCHDLRSSLQMVPQGESPSSSASDIDNLNNHALVDKSSLSKSNGTHVENNHILASRSRSSFARLLDFTKYVNLAMEASMKCQNALATANVMLEEAQNKDGIVSVKRVIDFSFQDVEELVRLVGLAKEAINRKAFCGSRN